MDKETDEFTTALRDSLERAFGVGVEVHVLKGESFNDSDSASAPDSECLMSDPAYIERLAKNRAANEGRHSGGLDAQNERQRKALRGLDKRIRDIEETLPLLKELRASIATPLDERGPMQALTEVLLADRIFSKRD